MSKGISWEREVANYLETRGYTTKVRETISGHEVDVYATKEGESLAVECKDWDSSVTPDPIRNCHTVANDIGATPGIAYTSDLASGAQDLAGKWDFVILTTEIVREQVLTIEDVSQAAHEHEICLLEEEDLSRLDNPLSPYIPGDDFAEAVAEAAKQLTFEPLEKGKEGLRRQIRSICERSDIGRCVPILRHDQGRIQLYFIDYSDHDALPDNITVEELDLH